MTFIARAGVVTILVGALTIASPLAAHAGSDASASTDPSGAHVQLARRGAWVEVRPPGGSYGNGSSATSPGCQRRWVPTKYPRYLRPRVGNPDIHSTPMPPAPRPDYVAYFVYCDGTYLDSVWLLPSAFSPTAGAVDVLAIAEQLVRDLPYPAATVGVSPEGRGLTGLESWFWVNGYSGPLHDAVTGLGLRVEVEAVPGAVRWDFGDGTPPQAGTLGTAAPTRSDVVHTYETRSRATPLSIHATVRLDVRYRVNDEPWQALDPVVRVATRAYPVAESRAALVTPR
ncbi:MAG: hypothetical protein ACXV9P_12100 [Acidimicrobiia bacterium]